MNPVSFPLNHASRGPDVVTLQQALLHILRRAAILGDDEGFREELISAIQDEMRQQVFGDATFETVRIFQEVRGLGDAEHGTVDEITA